MCDKLHNVLLFFKQLSLKELKTKKEMHFTFDGILIFYAFHFLLHISLLRPGIICLLPEKLPFAYLLVTVHWGQILFTFGFISLLKYIFSVYRILDCLFFFHSVLKVWFYCFLSGMGSENNMLKTWSLPFVWNTLLFLKK